MLSLLEREPRDMLALLAGQVLSGNLAGCGQQQPVSNRPEPAPYERRPGDDPYLIDEDEFSYRARSMSYDEQKILRCRVNAARCQKKGYLDEARKFWQQADRLERKLLQTA